MRIPTDFGWIPMVIFTSKSCYKGGFAKTALSKDSIYIKTLAHVIQEAYRLSEHRYSDPNASEKQQTNQHRDEYILPTPSCCRPIGV